MENVHFWVNKKIGTWHTLACDENRVTPSHTLFFLNVSHHFNLIFNIL